MLVASAAGLVLLVVCVAGCVMQRRRSLVLLRVMRRSIVLQAYALSAMFIGDLRIF